MDERNIRARSNYDYSAGMSQLNYFQFVGMNNQPSVASGGAFFILPEMIPIAIMLITMPVRHRHKQPMKVRRRIELSHYSSGLLRA